MPALPTPLGSLAWKPALAWALRRPPGLWLLAAAHRFMPVFQPIGVLAVILDDTGRVLLLDHVTRATNPLGLPGGWLNRGERPEDGIRRELREELGVDTEDADYVLSAPHRNGEGSVYGLTLVYRVAFPGSAAVRLSNEIVGSGWYRLDETEPLLRGFEAEAVRRALSI